LNWLKEQKEILDWAYEVETFEFPVKKGSKFYTPDFKVVNANGSVEYHEVKGWLDPVSKTKLKRMAKYYPNLKLILIDREQYASISRSVKALIPNWELAPKHSW